MYNGPVKIKESADEAGVTSKDEHPLDAPGFAIHDLLSTNIVLVHFMSLF